jgi:hypothetical protein
MVESISSLLRRRALLEISAAVETDRLVRAEGFEPTSLAALEPKSSASASSATPAKDIGFERLPKPASPGGAAYSMLPRPRSNKNGVPRRLQTSR